MAVNRAVTNKTGLVSLFPDERDKSESSLYASPLTGTQGVVVEATSLDDFFECRGWPPVHLVKMDIEGAEKAALEGMKQLVDRNRSLKLIVEFSPRMQAAAGVSSDEFLDTLTRLGFQRIWALCNGLQPMNILDDIPRLVRMARDGYINLFCER